MKFGDCLRIAREDRELTQTDLAKLLDVTPQSISRYEKNEVEPRVSFAVDVSRVLDISLDDLMQLNRNKRYQRFNDYLVPVIAAHIELDETGTEYKLVKNNGVNSIFNFDLKKDPELDDTLIRLCREAEALGDRVAEDFFAAQFTKLLIETMQDRSTSPSKP